MKFLYIDVIIDCYLCAFVLTHQIIHINEALIWRSNCKALDSQWVSVLKWPTRYLSAGAGESGHWLRLGLRLWNRQGQQARPVACFQQRWAGGHDGVLPPGSPELLAGQRGQSGKLPLLQPAGIHASLSKIWRHLDSVGLRSVLQGRTFALHRFPARKDDTWD